MPLQTISQAAKAVGISAGTIRNLTTGRYSAPYKGLFSPGAAPGTGAARIFTDRDIALLRYVKRQSDLGRMHADIAADIRAGVLDSAQEEEPGESETFGEDAAPPGEGMPRTPEQSAAMVVWGWGRMLQEQLTESRERETELNERLIEAEAARRAAEREVEMLREQLAERRKGFWARLTGR